MADNDDFDAGTKSRDDYTALSCQNCFGTSDVSAFDPSQGFAANRDRMLQLYAYYQSTAQKAPDLFLWMSLGHMAGGTIVSGLDQTANLNYVSSAATTIEKTLMETARNIFLDLAWLHEAYLDSPDTAATLAQERDGVDPKPAASYAKAFQDIASGDADRITAGNLALLRNEQACLVQPGMVTLANGDTDALLGHARAFTANVHPYHRDFLTVCPNGSVASLNDRWAWIMETDGMWAKWVVMPSVAPDERNRLVALGMADLMAARFGDLVQELLPTGADDQ